MTRTVSIVAACCAAALLAAGVAYATTSTYIGPKYWCCYESGSSSYWNQWFEAYFIKSTSGVSDTAITFIDNGVFGYSWHSTLRGTQSFQHIYWDGDRRYTKKSYCKYYSGTTFNGSCTVAS